MGNYEIRNGVGRMGISTTQISQYILDLQQDLKVPAGDGNDVNVSGIVKTDRSVAVEDSAAGMSAGEYL